MAERRKSRNVMSLLSDVKVSAKPAYKGKVHKAIIDATQVLMLERSLEGISVDDIVSEAKVAKGSFYNHFSGKEDLASDIYDHLRFKASELVSAAINPEMPSPEQLITGAFVLVKFTVEHPQSACALLTLSSALMAGSAPLNLQAERIIRRGCKSGEFKNIPVDSATRLVIGIMLVMHQDSLNSSWPLSRILLSFSPLAAGLLKALGVDDVTGKLAVSRAMDSVACRH